MNEILNDCFAVIDVETNWNNEVMSIGIVLADVFDFDVIDKGYYIVYPECKTGGLYSHVLRSTDKELIRDCSRNEALNHICGLLKKHNVSDILAYNAQFDCKCLPELHGYTWRDILPVAANRNTNVLLPDSCEFFSTGLLKRCRGLENVLRLVYRRDYQEIHNGLSDALDELLLVKLIGLPITSYRKYNPKQASVYLQKKSASKIRESSLLNAYKYVVDELCGGSVRLISYSRTVDKINGETVFTDSFDLICSRCGGKWTQDADAFFKERKCPHCGYLK